MILRTGVAEGGLADHALDVGRSNLQVEAGLHIQIELEIADHCISLLVVIRLHLLSLQTILYRDHVNVDDLAKWIAEERHLEREVWPGERELRQQIEDDEAEALQLHVDWSACADGNIGGQP